MSHLPLVGDHARSVGIELEAQAVLFHRDADAEIGKIQRVVQIAGFTAAGIPRSVLVVAQQDAGGKQAAVAEVVQGRVGVAGVVAKDVAGSGIAHAQAVDVFSVELDGKAVVGKDRVSRCQGQYRGAQ